MFLVKIVAIVMLAQLCPLAAKCHGGVCDLDDSSSLLQVKQDIKTGAKQSDEKSFLQEKQSMLPPQPVAASVMPAVHAAMPTMPNVQQVPREQVIESMLPPGAALNSVGFTAEVYPYPGGKATALNDMGMQDQTAAEDMPGPRVRFALPDADPCTEQGLHPTTGDERPQWFDLAYVCEHRSKRQSPWGINGKYCQDKYLVHIWLPSGSTRYCCSAQEPSMEDIEEQCCRTLATVGSSLDRGHAPAMSNTAVPHRNELARLSRELNCRELVEESHGQGEADQVHQSASGPDVPHDSVGMVSPFDSRKRAEDLAHEVAQANAEQDTIDRQRQQEECPDYCYDADDDEWFCDTDEPESLLREKCAGCPECVRQEKLQALGAQH
jgi:hypothetical protein